MQEKDKLCGYKPIPLADNSKSLGVMQAPHREFIYSPTIEIMGENSSADPTKVRGGEFQLLQGMRFANDEFRVRDGSMRMTSAPASGTLFRGAFTGYLDGSTRVYVAYRNTGTSRTLIYEVGNLSGTTTGSWVYTEITAVATRFPTDGYVSFAIVSDGLGPFPADILVMSNGTDPPLVWGDNHEFLSFGGSCDIQRQTTAPIEDRCTATPDFAAYVDLRLVASTAAGAVTGGGNTNTKTLANGEYYFAMSLVAVGTATITFAATPCWVYDASTTNFNSQATLPLNLGTQVVLIMDDDITDPIWNYAGLIATSGTGDITLYDPTSTLYDSPFYWPLNDAGTQYLVAFNLVSAQVVCTAATGIKIDLTQAPTAARTLNVYGIMHTGYVDSTSNYTITHLDQTSRAESGGVVCLNKSGPKLGGVGGRGCAGTLVTSKMPTPVGLYATHRIVYPHTPRTTGVDYTILYRQDPGETDYFYVGLMATPRTTSNWLDNSFYIDNAKSSTRYLTRPAPAFSTVGTPYAKYLLAANGRLYAAGVGDSELWISFDRAPFRFSQIAPVTGPNAPKNPAYHRLQGELITGILDYPGQNYGVAPVNLFTDKKVYRIEGTDSFSLSRLNTLKNSVGTPFPRSITRHLGNTYCLGADRQIWMYGDGGTGPISRYRIDDRLKSSTMTSCYGSASEYGYVLTAREVGDSTQNTMYRYDSISNKWGSDRFTKTGIAGTLMFDTSDGTRRLLIFGDDAKVYWFEKSGQVDDDGTSIPISIKTRELSSDCWSKIALYHLGIYSNIPAVTPLLTVTKTGAQSGIASVSYIDYAGATGLRVYRVDVANDAVKSMPGILDVSGTVQIDGPCSGGMRIQAIVLEVEQYGESPDAQ